MDEDQKEEWVFCKCKMEQEGLHYSFAFYSDWNEIKDEKFHELRKDYLKAAKLLREYVNKKAKEDF